MNGAQRADPSAEEAPEKQCWDKDDQADEQAFVQGVRGQCIRNRNQRIEPEEQSHGVKADECLARNCSERRGTPCGTAAGEKARSKRSAHTVAAWLVSESALTLLGQSSRRQNSILVCRGFPIL